MGDAVAKRANSALQKLERVKVTFSLHFLPDTLSCYKNDVSPVDCVCRSLSLKYAINLVHSEISLENTIHCTLRRGAMWVIPVFLDLECRGRRIATSSKLAWVML